MKIKVKKADYEQVLQKSKPRHRGFMKPNIFFRTLIRVLSIPDMLATKFSYTKHNMDKAGKGPYLILMNHSSFIDLKIASKILYPMPYGIVCTSDGFVGIPWLMRWIGCLPTQKFVPDATLIKDIMRALSGKKLSVLMYPEASYSFDGCATALPRHLGKLIKKLNVPVLTIITDGAFLRQPLYNCLKLRRVKVSAKLTCLLSKDEIAQKSADEIMELLDKEFSFNHFKAQAQNGTEITEGYRAEGLERILYRCAACGKEGHMAGKLTTLTCTACGKSYRMDTLGRLNAIEGETEFPLIPDWYSWERECVKGEIENGEYLLDTDVDIYMLRDFKAIYDVGEGHLTHNKDGFTLTGCDGRLSYTQSPAFSYGLYADYYWYEIGDVICIGNNEFLYYCFPKTDTPVAKARLAAEEMFKLTQRQNIKA